MGDPAATNKPPAERNVAPLLVLLLLFPLVIFSHFYFLTYFFGPFSIILRKGDQPATNKPPAKRNVAAVIYGSHIFLEALFTFQPLLLDSFLLGWLQKRGSEMSMQKGMCHSCGSCCWCFLAL